MIKLFKLKDSPFPAVYFTTEQISAIYVAIAFNTEPAVLAETKAICFKVLETKKPAFFAKEHLEFIQNMCFEKMKQFQHTNATAFNKYCKIYYKAKEMDFILTSNFKKIWN